MNLPKGLTIIEDFVTKDEEEELVNNINNSQWNTKLRRYTQHYGYEYNYTTKTITEDDRLGDLPEWTDGVIEKVMETGKIEKEPDQIIVNRYLPGEGIYPHIDRPKIFGDQIYSLSLNSDCVMRFKRGSAVRNIYLKRRSLLIMEDEARYEWYHSIPAVKSDHVNGTDIVRGTRYSITFRNVVLGDD